MTDMDERVNNTIQIIDDDGDTFAKRAEMYYQKRPELLNLVEEAYRSYRALAERYDHLSRDFQSANRTIASAFPERAHELSMDEDDEQIRKSSSKGPPGAPDFRSTSMVTSRKKQLKRIISTIKAKTAYHSGLTKSEALEEINRLQKGILVLQTETEFVKSTYDNANAKYWEIQTQITEMQEKVCSLEDEFGIGTLIDDNEARTLMATTALNSCQETLGKLQEQHEKSANEVNFDHGRIKEAHGKVAMLRKKFLPPDELDEKEVKVSDLESNELDDNLERFLERIKTDLVSSSNTPLTVLQMAEKIDEILDKVVHLETSVFSQTALAKRLRSETDELMSRIRGLEEKEVLVENTENMKNRIKQLEDELERVKSLNRNVRDENKNIKSQLTEASCNIDHFIQKLQKVKLDEEFEDNGFSQDSKAVDSNNHVKENKDKLIISEKSSVLENIKTSKEPIKEKIEGETNLGVISTVEETNSEKNLSENTDRESSMGEETGTDEEGEQPDWRQLFMNGIEDREKVLLDEYTSVLRNYKEVKLKLGDVEKKNRDGFYELALQIRELKNVVHKRDEEIQVLQKMSPMANNSDETVTDQEPGPESINLAPPSSLNSAFSSPRPPPFQQPTAPSSGKMKPPQNVKSQEITTIQGKIRSDIDEILEENLEFWLRFSESFHQIKKFQTSVRDLRTELYKLKDKIKREGSLNHSGKQQTMYAEAKPIYKHLRDIQTELTLWCENNVLLKDEIQRRYSSLCNIQDEVSKSGEEDLSEFQAAKFLGEITNMKQENKKVGQEIQAGFDRVQGLKAEVEKILSILDEELGISATSTPTRSASRPRIPLRSFLFGVKLKRQKNQNQLRASLLSCVSPALQRQYSDLIADGRIPE
ncbi:hypothetical protein ACFE04_025943 [Oxalis oulophora]